MLRSFALASALAAAQLPTQTSAPRDSIRDDRTFSFYDRGPYRTQVPRPDSLLGYPLGDMNTQYAAQERTLLAIADAAKDRVRVEPFGSSYERRTMRLYIVSAPENIQRLDAIRAALDTLADPRGVPPTVLSSIAARVPAVVWVSESVHGNESPGFENAMPLLYQLAASEEPATLDALRNTIVVINPSSNPDGHERFAVWYNSVTVRSPDPGSVEKDEPWSINGRHNHYRFDMNRDVSASTQREVQALLRAMQRWRPMVAIDQHGQVSTYFFPPAARPVNENLGGATAAKWLDTFGRANAAAFDRYGWMYFSRDVYDLYAPFYWDTGPGLTGAIGMTYETDGGGWKGIVYRREDGTLLSFRDGIAKHFVSSLSTIEATAAHRAERVRDYLRFRQDAAAGAGLGTMRRVVLVPGRDPARAAELVAALLRSGVEVRRSTVPFSAGRAHAYSNGGVGSKRFESGAYVIDLAQPQGRLAKANLEPNPTLDPRFEQAQLDKYRRNIRRGKRGPAEEYEFYDVTAFSLPVAYGVEAYWTEDSPAVTGDRLSLPPDDPPLPEAQQRPQPARTLASRPTVVGGERLAVEIPSGVVGGARAKTAYLFTPERNGASRLAYQLLDDGIVMSVTTQPVDVGGRSWPRGTYIVRVARNDTTLFSRLDRLARESGVEVFPVNTASSGGGQYGIGSESVQGLTRPKVAILADDGVSQTSYGALWFTFERRYGIRFTPVGYGYLTGGRLTDFNVLVIPSAEPSALSDHLGKDGVERLKAWVRAGGTLITMEGASAWAAKEDVALTSARTLGDLAQKDTTPPKANPASDDSTAKRRRRGEVSDKAMDVLIPLASPSASNAVPQPIPGATFDVALDRTHWLTFGYEDPRVTVMLQGGAFLRLSKEGSNVGVFPTTGPLHRAGFIWPDNTERLLRGTAYLIDEPLGEGHVVLFANEPMFRGWWRALDRLVLNAVVLGPAF